MAYTKQVSQLHGIIQYCLPPKPFFNHKPGECHLQFFLRMVVEHNLREDYGENRRVMIVGFIRFNFFPEKSLPPGHSSFASWKKPALEEIDTAQNYTLCSWYLDWRENVLGLRAEFFMQKYWYITECLDVCVKKNHKQYFFPPQQTGSVVSLLLQEKKNTEKPPKDWKKLPNLTILCNCLWDWEKLTNPTTPFQHDF